jgi:hypothetical protein
MVIEKNKSCHIAHMVLKWLRFVLINILGLLFCSFFTFMINHLALEVDI